MSNATDDVDMSAPPCSPANLIAACDILCGLVGVGTVGQPLDKVGRVIDLLGVRKRWVNRLFEDSDDVDVALPVVTPSEAEACVSRARDDPRSGSRYLDLLRLVLTMDTRGCEPPATVPEEVKPATPVPEEVRPTTPVPEEVKSTTPVPEDVRPTTPVPEMTRKRSYDTMDAPIEIPRRGVSMLLTVAGIGDADPAANAASPTKLAREPPAPNVAGNGPVHPGALRYNAFHMTDDNVAFYNFEIATAIPGVSYTQRIYPDRHTFEWAFAKESTLRPSLFHFQMNGHTRHPLIPRPVVTKHSTNRYRITYTIRAATCSWDSPQQPHCLDVYDMEPVLRACVELDREDDANKTSVTDCGVPFFGTLSLVYNHEGYRLIPGANYYYGTPPAGSAVRYVRGPNTVDRLELGTTYYRRAGTYEEDVLERIIHSHLLWRGSAREFDLVSYLSKTVKCDTRCLQGVSAFREFYSRTAGLHDNAMRALTTDGRGPVAIDAPPDPSSAVKSLYVQQSVFVAVLATVVGGGRSNPVGVAVPGVRATLRAIYAVYSSLAVRYGDAGLGSDMSLLVTPTAPLETRECFVRMLATALGDSPPPVARPLAVVPTPAVARAGGGVFDPENGHDPYSLDHMYLGPELCQATVPGSIVHVLTLASVALDEVAITPACNLRLQRMATQFARNALATVPTSDAYMCALSPELCYALLRDLHVGTGAAAAAAKSTHSEPGGDGKAFPVPVDSPIAVFSDFVRRDLMLHSMSAFVAMLLLFDSDVSCVFSNSTGHLDGYAMRFVRVHLPPRLSLDASGYNADMVHKASLLTQFRNVMMRPGRRHNKLALYVTAVTGHRAGNDALESSLFYKEAYTTVHLVFETAAARVNKGWHPDQIYCDAQKDGHLLYFPEECLNRDVFLMTLSQFAF